MVFNPATFFTGLATTSSLKSAENASRKAIKEALEQAERQRATDQKGIREAASLREGIARFVDDQNAILANEVPLINSQLKRLEGGFASKRTNTDQFQPLDISGPDLKTVALLGGLALLIAANPWKSG